MPQPSPTTVLLASTAGSLLAAYWSFGSALAYAHEVSGASWCGTVRAGIHISLQQEIPLFTAVAATAAVRTARDSYGWMAGIARTSALASILIWCVAIFCTHMPWR